MPAGRAFHHRTATHVEAHWEVEQLLELSDVVLCLDTGHLLVGGGDPLQGLRDWSTRINHIHLKDARTARIAEIVADAAPVEEIWRRRAFCVLGDGGIDVPAVIEYSSARAGTRAGSWSSRTCFPTPINRDSRRWISGATGRMSATMGSEPL